MRQCAICEYSHVTTTWGSTSLASTVMWLQHDVMRQCVTCEYSHMTTTWGRASLKAVINFQWWSYNCGMYNRLLWETANSELTEVTIKCENRANLKPRTLHNQSLNGDRTICGFLWQLIICHVVICPWLKVDHNLNITSCHVACYVTRSCTDWWKGDASGVHCMVCLLNKIQNYITIKYLTRTVYQECLTQY